MGDGLNILRRSMEALGLSKGITLRLIYKHGRILCALPDDRELALVTLGLYCPQRLAGRLAATAVRSVVRLGMSGFAIRSKITMENAGGDLESCGILVGSSAHAIERAVAVMRGESGFEVAKIALGDQGRRALEQEASMLRHLEHSGLGAPSLAGIETRDGVTVMRMPFDDGAPYQEEALGPVLNLLESWGKNERRRLDEFEEWLVMEPELLKYGVRPELLTQIAGLSIRVSLRHGDFTRWNLRVGAGGSFRVHDWERGCLEGPAGFDLIYYLVQDALLVKRLPPEELVDHVKRVVSTPKVSALLRDWGWSGAERELLLTVFAFSNAAGYEDYSKLLRYLSQAGD